MSSVVLGFVFGLLVSQSKSEVTFSRSTSSSGKFVGVYASEGVTWYEAATYCSRILGPYSLATIENDNENDEAVSAVKNAGLSNCQLWIGLNDQYIEGDFDWLTDSTSNYRNWDDNQPNQYYKNEDCVSVNTNDGLWKDYQCTHRFHGFVCQNLQYTDIEGGIQCGNTISSDCISEFNNLGVERACDRCINEGGSSPLRTRCSKCCTECDVFGPNEPEPEPIDEDKLVCGNYISSDCTSEFNNLDINSFCTRCITEGGSSPLRTRCSKCCSECDGEITNSGGNYGTNDGYVTIKNGEGCSRYWHVISVENVGSYVTISKVYLSSASNNYQWVESNSNWGSNYGFSLNGGWDTPYNVKIVTTDGQEMKSNGVITNINQYSLFSIGKKFYSPRRRLLNFA